MDQVEPPKRFDKWPVMSRATKTYGQLTVHGPMILADREKSVFGQCKCVAVTGA